MPVVINGSVRHANGVGVTHSKAYVSTVEPSSTLLSKFVESHKELESYKYVRGNAAYRSRLMGCSQKWEGCQG